MILNNLPFIMLKCLILTIVIEFIVASILKVKDKKDLLNVVLVNCLTNPIVVSFPVYFNIKYGIFERRVCLIILEILTLIVEGIIYKKYLKFKKINPYILSLILNSSSYIIGEFINNI